MKKLILVLLILLTSCATLPLKESCTLGDIQYVILEGFEMEHDSCIHDLVAISWKIEINVCENSIMKRTNLFTFWDGCGYKLYQEEDNFKDIMFIGRFPNLDKMEEFLKITMPMTRVKP
jgi:hypothetical protein